MASKLVIDRERSARQVSSMLRQHAAQVSQKLDVRVAPILDKKKKEQAPDSGHLLEVHARLLDGATRELVEADAAHEAEESDDAGPRKERDKQHAAGYELIVAIRGTVDANFGDLGLRALGVWDPCPNVAQGVLTYARNFAKQLASPVKLPAPKTKHVQFNRKELAAELTQIAEHLGAALDVVAREESELKATQVRKDEAIAAYDETFRAVTYNAMGLFRLAGMGELADRIKPSSRRPGTLESTDQPPPVTPDVHS
jgi:hypothetical protein